jgi:hypothetical protein
LAVAAKQKQQFDIHSIYRHGHDSDFELKHNVASHNQSIFTMATPGTICCSPGCEKVVTSNLACPKCLQLGMPPAYFCNQDCFKTNYAGHKQVHSLAKQIIAAQGYVISLLAWTMFQQ